MWNERGSNRIGSLNNSVRCGNMSAAQFSLGFLPYRGKGLRPVHFLNGGKVRGRHMTSITPPASSHVSSLKAELDSAGQNIQRDFIP